MTIRTAALGAFLLTTAIAAPASAGGAMPVFPGARLDVRHSTPLNTLYHTNAAAATVVAWYRKHLADHQVQVSGDSLAAHSTTHFIDPSNGDIDVDVVDAKPPFSPTRTDIRFNKH